MARQDALRIVFSRNAFYRRLHFLILSAFLLSIVVIAALLGVLYFLIKNPTGPIYFATDHIGRLTEIIPVSQPNMPLENVTDWTIEAVEKAYSYDYVNYRSQLQSTQKYFTRYGWYYYMRALTFSNNLLALKDRRQIVIAQVVEPPRLVTQGLLGGAYAYKFQVPVLVTYWNPPFNDTSKFSNPWIVSVIVQRQPTLQSYRGLGIVQMIAESAVGVQTQPQQLSNKPT